MPEVKESKTAREPGALYWADWLRIASRDVRRAGLAYIRLSVEEAERIAKAIEQDRKRAER
jgi:hypothetical protein